MARYTLTLSPNYVKDWSAEDAIREFLQNAIDQESLDSNNQKTIDTYIENKLIISNATSKLDKSTLLLGGGTKDGTDTIGQFGEGYKVAMLVLLRDGFKVTIKNYGLGELWIPKIVNSRIYNSEVLAIDTKEYEFKDNNPNSLSIEIEKEGYDFTKCLKDIWLEARGCEDYEVTTDGNILLDREEQGNIYINGLKVTHLDEYRYGYDFKPNIIKVGRDRNLVSGFDIEQAMAWIWTKVDESLYPTILEMLKDKVKDATWISDWKMPLKLKELIREEYKDKYVVSNESDKGAIKETFGKVETEVVPEAIRDVVYNGVTLGTGVTIKIKDAEDLLREFIEKYGDDLSEDMLEDLDIIMERI